MKSIRVSMRRRSSQNFHKLGQTMLELVAATVVIATALVPALRLTRNSLQSLERIEQSERCHFLCVSTLEESMVMASANWAAQPRFGDFSRAGWPEYLYQVTMSDSESEGGIPGSLAVIRVLVWYDANGSGTAEADEVYCQLETKLANLQSYGHEANVH